MMILAQKVEAFECLELTEEEREIVSKAQNPIQKYVDLMETRGDIAHLSHLKEWLKMHMSEDWKIGYLEG